MGWKLSSQKPKQVTSIRCSNDCSGIFTNLPNIEKRDVLFLDFHRTPPISAPFMFSSSKALVRISLRWPILFRDDAEAQRHDRGRMPQSLAWKTLAALIPDSKTSYFVTLCWPPMRPPDKNFVRQDRNEGDSCLLNNFLWKKEEATFLYLKILFLSLGSLLACWIILRFCFFVLFNRFQLSSNLQRWPNSCFSS